MKNNEKKPQISQMKKQKSNMYKVTLNDSTERREAFVHGCFQIYIPGGATRCLALIPSIPFILVKKAFSTGIKGMNAMLRMAHRAAAHASPTRLRDLTPVVIAR